MKLSKIFLICIYCLLNNLYSIETTRFPAETMVNILDCPCSTFNNPLKGLQSFTVLVPYKSPESQLFVQELEKAGQVKKFSLEDPEGINFEGMGTGLTLMLILVPLTEDSEPETMRISLNLSASVEILKTKNRVDSYIWATNVFSTNLKTTEAVKKAVNQFISYYKDANPDSKPMFYIYE